MVQLRFTAAFRNNRLAPNPRSRLKNEKFKSTKQTARWVGDKSDSKISVWKFVIITTSVKGWKVATEKRMQRFHALLIQYLRSFVIVARSQRLACKWMCESQRKYARCQIILFDQRFKIISFNGNSWGCCLQRINTINAIRGACVCVLARVCVWLERKAFAGFFMFQK